MWWRAWDWGGSGGQGEKVAVVGAWEGGVPAVFFVEGGLFEGDGAVDVLGEEDDGINEAIDLN